MQSMASSFPNHFTSEVLNGGGGFVIGGNFYINAFLGFTFCYVYTDRKMNLVLFLICFFDGDLIQISVH